MTLSDKPILMRDAFIDTLFDKAKADRDVFFLSADFGAQALDDFRAQLPGQFLHMGICEQNMVDVGAGLALSGKKVILYAMAPFITARCYEQVKAVVCSMNLPVTLLSVGVGLGYDHATMTHFTLEDLAVMKALNHIEVLTPADDVVAAAMADETVREPRFRYVRLERSVCPRLYTPEAYAAARKDGFRRLAAGGDLTLVACGHMTHRALEARRVLAGVGIDAGVIDIFRIKPLAAEALCRELGSNPRLVTVEEQSLEGGFGAAVAEALLDAGMSFSMRRIGVRDGFDVVNGDRPYLHQLYGIDVPSVVAAATALAQG